MHVYTYQHYKDYKGFLSWTLSDQDDQDQDQDQDDQDQNKDQDDQDQDQDGRAHLLASTAEHRGGEREADRPLNHLRSDFM